MNALLLSVHYEYTLACVPYEVVAPRMRWTGQHSSAVFWSFFLDSENVFELHFMKYDVALRMCR